MIIALAQITPATGNIEENISIHKKFILEAVAQKADLVVFPELSLTGYEPKMAMELACLPDDQRLQVFAEWSEQHQITIAAGLPLQTNDGVTIAHLIFEPDGSDQVYSKQFLHPDEIPYFVARREASGIIGVSPKIGLAICYELSVEPHLLQCLAHQAEVYLAAVAKHENGVAEAFQRLAEISKNYEIPTLMVNCFGTYDGMLCAGNTAVWVRGELKGKLDQTSEGLLFFNTSNQEVLIKTF